jgi:hypothetical protein
MCVGRVFEILLTLDELCEAYPALQSSIFFFSPESYNSVDV